MFDLHKIREEYDTKKIALVALLLFVIVGGIFAGLMLVSGRIDIRNRAANSCPVGVLKMVTCKFTVDSTVPFTYEVTVSSSTGNTSSDGTTGLYSATSGEREIIPTEPSTSIQESVEVQFTGTYTCDVKVTATVTNACGSKTATDTKNTSLVCTPPDGDTPSGGTTPPPDGPGGPTGPTGPDGPGGGSGPACKDCSKVELSIDFTDPGGPQPTLTPPNVNEDDLKIARLKLKWTTDACNRDPDVCKNVEKIEFSAYDNVNCEGPTVAPTPGDQDNRYGDKIKCEEASKDTGALIRLHQANGTDCRCYKATLKFADDPATAADDALFCPDDKELQVCCATTCKPPEIIDDPDDPNDGCIGDPSGSYPGDLEDPTRTKCYFNPVPQCFKPNVQAKLETYSSGPGTIDYDEDFEGTTDVIGAKDGEEHLNIYQDGGSYDIKTECIVGGTTYTCKKRVRVACTGGNPPGNPPPGGGGGNTPPPGGDLPACVVPPISGVCVDQPAT